MEEQVRSEEEITIINTVENTNVASSSSPPRKYEVFLSFRGEDTRCGFMSHLEKRLRDTKIETFIDNKLNKGDKISDALIEAIRSSKMSVIIFSVNYATSSWCLDEVLYIVECMEKQKQVVVPVFYNINPSIVRKQKGSYEAAFKDLKVRFEEEKVKQWISALTRVADLSGFPYPSEQYETESDFIGAIVEDILKKLKDMSPSDHHIKDLVGIKESIEGVKKLLQLDSRDVRIIGIWGMGGLGKTTLARAVFEQLSSNFEGCCFLANVREISGKLKGPEELKKELFSELLKEKDIKYITDFHKERLRRKQVLIVLDDVDQPAQLDELSRDQSWFGGGSRVIVTTRDEQVLRRWGRAAKKYELRRLSSECSLELFNLNAFERNYCPTSDDREVSKWVVNYAQGIPLALKVIGRLLSWTRRENWESVLDRLKEVPNKDVQSVLKISYDGLDEQEKTVFLDIVCFVDVGEKACRHYIEPIVGGGRFAKFEIDNLIDKSLIFEEQGNLRMHDLVREMGWEIVRLQSKEPGERSRLWNEEDCYNVLENNTGTKAIQGISQSNRWLEEQKPIELSCTVFKEMRDLRFLRINFGSYHCSEERLEYFPSTLKFLEWEFWPFTSMPKSFSLSNLVELCIPNSKLETLIWSEELNNLKHVVLSGSEMLTDVSALSKAPNLESVNLSHCYSLRIVPPLRFSDKSFHKCDYEGCSRLGNLDLSSNDNLEVVSIISGNVKQLDISRCHNLKQLHSCVFQLKSLTTLNLLGCNISKIPSEIGCLNLLEELDLAFNPIGEIPEGIKKLSKLKILMIRGCESLELLPELPLSIEFLSACGCTRLRTVSDSRDKLKQEQLSEYHVTRQWRFRYASCSLLSEDARRMIVEEFQLRVLRLAAKIHSNNFNVEELGYPEVYICFPSLNDKNITEWFTEYSEGSTVTVKLPFQWHNAAFLGFAFCVQVQVEEGNLDYHTDLKCNLDLRKKNGENCRFEWYNHNYSRDYVHAYGSSHMFMWYMYENYSSCSDAVELTVRLLKYTHTHRVTACGIRLLYGQEYEDKFEKSNVVSIEEPPFKRLRW